MATQLLTRKQRGEKIASEDIVQINSSSYFVRSQSGKGGYSVSLFLGKWSCDCFDHKYRQVQCKHIHAVQAQISKIPTERFSLGLWEPQK